MDTPLDWFALCCVLLFAKMFAISLVQGWHRIGSQRFVNQEDAGLVGRDPAVEELPQVERAARAWRNDLESITPFFALGIVYVMTGAAAASAPALFVTFTAARMAHTICYLRQLQPWRTLAYAVGIVCLFVMCVNILRTL
jgi:glutathione S-transferase